MNRNHLDQPEDCSQPRLDNRYFTIIMSQADTGTDMNKKKEPPEGVMMKKIDPRAYGLPARTVLMQNDPATFHLVIHRKSRIIMKDARNIALKAEKIKAVHPDAAILLETTAPVCSKSIQFLKDHHIDLLQAGEK